MLAVSGLLGVGTGQAAAAWQAPELLTDRGFSPVVAANARGDAAVAYTPAGDFMSGDGVAVAVAPAGQGFGAPEVLAAHKRWGVRVAVAENGDVFAVADLDDGCSAWIRPAGADRFGAPQALPMENCDLAAGDGGDAVVIGSHGSRGRNGGAWRRGAGEPFTDTGMVDGTREGRIAFGGGRYFVGTSGWADAYVLELRGAELVEERSLGYAWYERMWVSGRGDVLAEYKNTDHTYHRSIAAPGQPFAEVPFHSGLGADGTLASLRPDGSAIDVVAADGSTSTESVPPGFQPSGDLEFLRVDPAGLPTVFTHEPEPPERSGPDRFRRPLFAQRAAGGGWCPSQLWSRHGVIPAGIQFAGTGDGAAAAWQRMESSQIYVRRYRADGGCPAAPPEEPAPAPVASPTTVAAPTAAGPPVPGARLVPLTPPGALRARRRAGGRVVVTWRKVPGAARYRVKARIAARRTSRRVRRVATSRLVLRRVPARARVAISVAAVGRDSVVGRAARIRVSSR